MRPIDSPYDRLASRRGDYLDSARRDERPDWGRAPTCPCGVDHRGPQMVATYRYAYVAGTVDLCATHAAYHHEPLGAVEHGVHRGHCAECE